jgi:hypothetical protein
MSPLVARVFDPDPTTTLTEGETNTQPTNRLFQIDSADSICGALHPLNLYTVALPSRERERKGFFGRAV